MADFATLGLPESLVERLNAQAITEPTPVQAESIPALLAGRDALIQSQTGSGKTLAYLLPLIARLDPTNPHIQGLVVVPTQELGIQVREVARTLLAGTGMNALALIGGANPARQREALNKQQPRLVVGTPGRLVDFIQQQRLLLHELKLLVVDEVDHLVDEGKVGDVEQVLRTAAKGAQKAFLSATLADKAVGWARRYAPEAQEIRVSAPLALPKGIRHLAFTVENRGKIPTIRRLLASFKPQGAIAFVSQATDIPWLLNKLQHEGIQAAALHGGVKKLARAAIMQQFRAGKLQLLVATDLAARGLDLSGVGLVIHYDMPSDPAHYIHRVGRTGRMGREGMAAMLVEPQEAFVLEKYAKALEITFERPVLREGEVREATVIDLKREKGRAAAKVRKEKEKAAGPIKKKNIPQGPSAKAVAKGKAKKARKKAAGTWKGGAGTPKPEPAPESNG